MTTDPGCSTVIRYTIVSQIIFIFPKLTKCVMAGPRTSPCFCLAILRAKLPSVTGAPMTMTSPSLPPLQLPCPHSPLHEASQTVTVHFDFALEFIIIVTPPLRKADIWKDEIGDGTIHPIRPDATQYDQIRPNYLLFDVSVCSTREVASVVFLDRRSLILSRFPFCTLDNSMSPESGNRRAQQQRLHTTE